jgi:hypothetical protein
VQFDDFQKDLTRMVTLLDEHRTPVHPGLAPLAPTLDETASPADINQLIAQFWLEHMGRRTDGVREDAR